MNGVATSQYMTVVSRSEREGCCIRRLFTSQFMNRGPEGATLWPILRILSFGAAYFSADCSGTNGRKGCTGPESRTSTRYCT